MSTLDIWNNVPHPSFDSIFKVTIAYNADNHPAKVPLLMGVYRDDDSRPWVLPAIKKAVHILSSDPDLDHEYLPIRGLPEFTDAAAKLIFGLTSPALVDGRVVSVQTLSGTGANHTGALFLSRYYPWPCTKQIYLSDPTWSHFDAIAKNVGIEPMAYPYYDPKAIALDVDGFLGTLKTAPRGSVFFLQACAHNPTGIDPTPDQWKQIAEVIADKNHFAFFDCAYQGFASGDLDTDAWAIRYFVEKNIPLLVCQSFAKNAGLYGERVGALHMVLPNKDTIAQVRGQLSVLQWSEISSPPCHGARLVSFILTNADLFSEWSRDIKTMRSRLIAMRKELHRLLTEEFHTPGNWEHIVNQVGVYCYTGLSPDQSKALADKAHIYLLDTGRVSIAGLNSKNIRYCAENIDKAVRGAL
ncbi:aspartate aminotransferase [Hygrophoropsis aurantiaca]|uniref:Aspartate aminotransferase n=1 Tax=Hygrophoropsis aurantiaca TaxID=72124 RepID=A0ACB7ZWN3_9AGAM|nr:aspartate aminotransferase [Hygrophoropsis aurantiaca]